MGARRTNSRGLRWRVGDERDQVCSANADVMLSAGQVLSVDIASGGCWYGHGFSHRQPYPLNREPVVNDAFAVNNIQAPVWMCSVGVVILADTTAALAVRFNAGGSGRLEIVCRERSVPVHFFSGDDLPDAHRQLLRHLGWPNPAPEPALLGDSIFCTWTQYPRTISQTRVLSMARAIREREYPCSLLTIDDRWESQFGDLRFSAAFPQPAEMVSELHRLGFRVLLWVTPFINQEAANFPLLADQGFLVRRKDGTGPALLRWWGGTAGLVDLTHPPARAWFREQLLRLQQEFGVDGFKIDGGDAKYQPPIADSAWADYRGASGYADELLALFAEVAPGLCETRTAWRSQTRNILWRQGGKDSHWGIDNGLKALVNLGLHSALLGYDVLMPDMVPGRVQTMVSALPLPSDELLIRWTEVSAFFPLLQFSYFPWNYHSATAAVVLAYARVHKALEPYLVAQAASRQAPLLRPLWYDAPRQASLYSVEDEFQLGADLVVAPVTDENRIARDILLPPGHWVDAWTGKAVRGPLLRQYPAPCPGIPLFVRRENQALFAALHAALGAVPREGIPSGVTTATYSAPLDRDLSVTG